MVSAEYSEVYEGPISSRKRAFYWLVGLFIFLSPLAVAVHINEMPFKWARLGVTGLLGIVGLVWLSNVRSASRAFIWAALFFVVASAWGPNPLMGLVR